MTKKISIGYLLLLASLGPAQATGTMLSAQENLLQKHPGPKGLLNAYTLALSVFDPTNEALTGNPRQITITNTGTSIATGITVTSANLPIGTTISTTCGSSLAPAEACSITVSPGSIANADETGTACTINTSLPIAGSVTVNSADSGDLSIDVVVLGYGCIYQSGYVYSIDDAYSRHSMTQSIGGKVAALQDAAHRIIWSANSSGTFDTPGISIWGIDETSTSANPSPNESTPGYPAILEPGQSNCDGNVDGACNTSNIVTYYSTIASPAVNPNNYAAGLCTETVGGYSDWYLPAICELGSSISSPNATQGAGCLGNPFQQNMIDNLAPLVIPRCVGSSCLSPIYWSSTESSLESQQTIVWIQSFLSDGNGGQYSGGKYNKLPVRCARALT